VCWRWWSAEAKVGAGARLAAPQLVSASRHSSRHRSIQEVTIGGWRRVAVLGAAQVGGDALADVNSSMVRAVVRASIGLRKPLAKAARPARGG